jgi:hypothetical protein
VCGGAAVPHAAYLRRLTHREYDRVLRDLLGLDHDVSRALKFPDDDVVDGFDNNATALGVPAPIVDRYRVAAERVSATALATPEGRARVLGCEPTGSERAACLDRFIRAFGRRAFRRPPTDEETKGLAALAARAPAAPDPYLGPRLVVAAVLQAPSFLFRVEVGAPEAGRPGLARLTGYEVAARLSFLLWGAAPDEALLSAAEAGALDGAAGIADRARAMLKDPRARAHLRQFFGQWLHLDALADVKRDTNRYPAWGEALQQSMREETLRFVEDFVWPDAIGLLDALTARHSHVDARLAKLYGAPAPTGTGFARVDWTPAHNRGGLLTQGSLLTLAAPAGEVLAPVYRGMFVREVLLCTPLPAPPADVPPISESKEAEAKTVRERLAQHRTDPTCGGCHAMLDPLGLGLERYDLLGVWRTKDDGGRPLSGQGELNGFAGVPAPFTGAEELAQRLRGMPETAACVVTQLHRFAYGRHEEEADACVLGQATARFATGGHRFLELLQAVVSSDAFRYLRSL